MKNSAIFKIFAIIKSQNSIFHDKIKKQVKRVIAFFSVGFSEIAVFDVG